MHIGFVRGSSGAEFAVLALPMDVQVSKAEWAKYDKGTPLVWRSSPQGLYLAEQGRGGEQRRALHTFSILCR